MIWFKIYDEPEYNQMRGGVFKIYDEPLSPTEGSVLKIYDDPEPPSA